MSEETDKLIVRLLIGKLGIKAIEQLLQDVAITTENPDRRNRPKYGRYLEKAASPFHRSVDDEDGMGREVIEPAALIEVIQDASDELNYSNYHQARFDVVCELIYRYCEEKNIPLRFERDADGELDSSIERGLRKQFSESGS